MLKHCVKVRKDVIEYLYTSVFRLKSSNVSIHDFRAVDIKSGRNSSYTKSQRDALFLKFI